MSGGDRGNKGLIRTTVDSGIATITLSRPERRNALTRSMTLQFCAAIDAVDGDDEIRAVIVTGQGTSFSVGGDLEPGAAVFAQSPPGGDPKQRRDAGGILALRLFACTKPVIAAVNGVAAGLGATMLLPMDIRLASTTARFSFPFTRRGIVPEACSSWFLPRIVGISRALDWTMSGRTISAEEAREAGMLRTLHEPSALLTAAAEVAHALTAASSPVSVAATRQMLWHSLTIGHPAAVHGRESTLIRSLGAGPDAREGIEAFLEKRPARFTSRPSRDLAPFAAWWRPPPGHDESAAASSQPGSISFTSDSPAR